MAFIDPPTEIQSALTEKRGMLEDLVTQINDLYDPEGYDESMGGLSMMLNNALFEMDKVLDTMIHKNKGISPYYKKS